jgi:pyruvate formate lyase activating enzyme
MKNPDRSPFYGYLQKPSLVDFPGKITAVFFTSGCNFSCGYCHNAPLLGKVKSGLDTGTFTEAVRKFMTTDWVTGITLSGGEPTLSSDLPFYIRWLKDRGLAVKLDTNGSNPAMLEKIIDDLDYIAMDVKCSLENYPSFVKFTDTDAITASIQLIRDQAADYEFRTTIIEAFHTPSEMHAIGKLIKGAKRYTLQPFLPRDDLPDKAYRTMRRTSPDLLKEYCSLMEPYARNIIWKGRL